MYPGDGTRISSWSLGDVDPNSGACESHLSSMAHRKGLSTFTIPDQCKLLVVCAGSPRAASTAECAMAKHILQEIMRTLDSKQSKGSTDSFLVDAGYFNFHLHTICSGDECERLLPDGPIRGVQEWRELKFDSVDDNTRAEIAGALDLYEEYEHRVASAKSDSVLLVKSHEFDADLTDACHARIILTSERKESDVFESAVKLKWFTPDMFGAAKFERYNELWHRWRRCWTATGDDPGTRVFDLDSDRLEEEYSFREQMWRLTEMLARSLDLGPDVLDTQGVVDRVFERDFHRDLNPLLSNGYGEH